MSSIQSHVRVSAGDVTERVAARLKEVGVRFTAARRLVVSAMVLVAGPQAASDLYRLVGDHVPVSSLYRTLSVLSEAGVLQRDHDPAGVARYELADWLVGHHHHLVCLECDSVEDVSLEPDLEERLESILDEVAARSGFEVTGHRIDIEGLGTRCH